MRTTSMRARIALFVLALLATPDLLAQPQVVPLNTWFSSTRGDHFSTTDPAWSGAVGARKPDGYEMIRAEGLVFNPALPQPPGTVPLYSFWHPGRTDNFATTDPRWTNEPNPSGYRRFRLEGYVFDRPRLGTLPLMSYWSPGRTDNAASTDARLSRELRQSGDGLPSMQGAGYTGFRVEGYLLPADTQHGETSRDHVANLGSIGYGAWRPLQPSERGSRPADVLQRARARFSTPLIIAPVAFADSSFGPADLTRYTQMAQNDSPLSLARAVRSYSNGAFYWQPTMIPVVRDPLTFTQLTNEGNALRALRDDTPDAFQRTSGYSLDAYDVDRNGTTAADVYGRSRVLKLIDRFVRFNQYDTNRDGRVDASELVVMRFGADGGIGGQMGGSGGYWLDNVAYRTDEVRLDGVIVDTSVLMVAKNTTLAGLTHEMLHTWGGIDIYGPCYGCHNQGASSMAAMALDDRMIQLDPWHKAKFGWTQPLFVPITSATRQAGGLRAFAGFGGGITDLNRPIAFYDPARGLQEYFLVEFRTPFPGCSGSTLPRGECPTHPDAGAATVGFAVWHVNTDANQVLTVVSKSGDPAGRYLWTSSQPATAQTRGLGVIDATTGVIGRPRFLQPADGELALRWMDGSDTGLRLQAGPMSTTSSTGLLRWRDASTPVAFRLDVLRVPGFLTQEYPEVRAGTALAVDGAFDVAFQMEAALVPVGGGATRRVEVTTAAPTRAILRIPTDTPAGRYEVVVAPRGATERAAERSNGLRLQIPLNLIAVSPDVIRPDAGLNGRILTDRVLNQTVLDQLQIEPTPAALPPPAPPGAAPTDVYLGLSRGDLLQLNPVLTLPDRPVLQPVRPIQLPNRPVNRKD